MESSAEPLDKVRIVLKDREYVGVLMPRPDMADSDHLTLKLESGYNIGIFRDNILDMKLLEKANVVSHKNNSGDVKIPGLPKVVIISTGGTIASKVDYQTGGVNASFSASDLLDAMPELAKIANLEAKSVMNIMSEDMNPDIWIEMAKEISDSLNGDCEGVVVTHGTDTMAFSTAAMSFLLKDLNKPVIFTGSQRSTDRGSADSFLNMICSVRFALDAPCGVYLVMHGGMSDNFCLAHKGTKVRKMHTTKRDAFKSINASAVAKINADGSIEYLVEKGIHKKESKVTVGGLNKNVAMVKAYPGMDPDIFDFHLQKQVKGIVIEGTALGHVPTNIKGWSVIDKIKALIDAGVVVVMSTQCLWGRVNPYVYSNLRKVSSIGVVYLEDMLPETAYVKLMWSLNEMANEPSLVKSLMLENVAGELTEKTLIEDEPL